MQLVRQNPWELMSHLRRDVDRLFDSEPTAPFVPAVDIYEEAARYVVEADLPGIDPTAIEITVDGNILTIKGERRQAEITEDTSLQRAERPRGPFERSFKLPKSVANDGFSAEYQNGVLRVAIPKSDRAKPYRIEVTAN